MKERGTEMKLTIVSPFMSAPSLSKDELKNSTIITKQTKIFEKQPKAVILNNQIVFISLKIQDNSFLKEFTEYLRFFSERGVNLLCVSVSQYYITTIISQNSKDLDQFLVSLQNQYSKFGKLSVKKKYSLISLIGNKIKNIYNDLSDAFDFFQHYKIHFSSQPNRDIIQFVVSSNKAFSFLGEIHHSLFYDRPDDGKKKKNKNFYFYIFFFTFLHFSKRTFWGSSFSFLGKLSNKEQSRKMVVPQKRKNP